MFFVRKARNLQQRLLLLYCKIPLQLDIIDSKSIINLNL